MSNPCPRRKLRAMAEARRRGRRIFGMHEREVRKMNQVQELERRCDELHGLTVSNWYRSMVIWRALLVITKSKGGGITGWLARVVAQALVTQIATLHAETHLGRDAQKWFGGLKWGELEERK